MRQRQHWVPEIMYEDNTDNGISSSIPFIPVPKEEIMPQVLFIFESRETGDFEPDNSGEESPVFEMELHQYADMAILKKNLSQTTYDEVRNALGLEPLQSATTKGQKLSEKIKSNIENPI